MTRSGYTVWVVDPPGGDDDGDGEDYREFFTSRREAERRAREIVRDIEQEGGYRFGTVWVRRMTVPRLPARRLLVETLNRHGCWPSDEVLELTARERDGNAPSDEEVSESLSRAVSGRERTG